MTNVKIQMTNQIQMFKCLNYSVKNPDPRSGLLPRSLCRKRLSLRKAAFQAENNFPPESQKPVQFGDSALKSLWPFSIVHSTRDSGFLTSSRSHFWILVFDILLTFELWHLKLKIQYSLLAAPFWDQKKGHLFWAWILYSRPWG